MRTNKSLEKMKALIVPGGVYRREDFLSLTKNVDRNLLVLVKEKVLTKLQAGLYTCPKKTVFGVAPANEENLLQSFLKDNHFVVYSLNAFNSLGLGTTQLYDKRVVFNRKRHGEFTLGNRTYFFHRWREAPKQLSKEFLLVELVNRLSSLAEDQKQVMSNVEKKLTVFDRRKLLYASDRYGTVSTQKKLKPLLDSNHVFASAA